MIDSDNKLRSHLRGEPPKMQPVKTSRLRLWILLLSWTDGKRSMDDKWMTGAKVHLK